MPADSRAAHPSDRPAGPAGLAALVGPAGLAALVGSAGLAALVGPAGLAALVGSAGLAALVGPAGLAALVGPAGLAALVGPAGLAALVGPAGLAALVGPADRAAHVGDRAAGLGPAGTCDRAIAAACGSCRRRRRHPSAARDGPSAGFPASVGGPAASGARHPWSRSAPSVRAYRSCCADPAGGSGAHWDRVGARAAADSCAFAPPALA